MQVLEKRKSILRAHKLMRQGFLGDGALESSSTLGYPSGQDPAKVWYIQRLDFWLAQIPESNRLFNCFGFDSPQDVSVLDIAVEANSPSEGLNRNIGGVYLKDSHGRMYIGHRGIIRGNHPIRKAVFLQMFADQLVTAQDGTIETELLVISALDSPKLVSNLLAFSRVISLAKRGSTSKSRLIAMLKELDAPAANGQTSEPPGSKSFTPERTGSSVRIPIDQLSVRWNHGVVVATLKNQLEEDGHSCSNDQQRDLEVVSPDGKTRFLIEVKTSSKLTFIYTAIGQLEYHSQAGFRKIMVVPSNVPQIVRQRLDELEIAVLTYSWSHGLPVFLEYTTHFRGTKDE